MKLFKWFAVVFLCAGIVFLVQAIRQSREAARASTCNCKIHCLWFALQNYEAANGHFPPAYVLGPDGKPWHSWRVLILPYLEEHDVYNRYRFDEPWNGPNNSKLADQISTSTFYCPSGHDNTQTQHTNYVLIVGEGTAFPGDTTTRRADIIDGEANTLMLCEVGDAGIHWMEPRDVELDALTMRPGTPGELAISSDHPRGPGVVFADGHYDCLRKSLPTKTLRALGTINGGEEVTRDAIFGAGQDPTCF